MIFLTNEQIQQVLDMKTCIAAMEDAYRELNEQRAGYRPRIDFYVPQEPHYYRWGTMEGASRQLGVFAIRMKSDMLAWENQDGFMVEDKYCMERGRYCGLIFLLSTRNAEPLALMNDGYLQHMRVGACAGLGTKYLARKNSKVLAMIGSGGMARSYAEAIKQVRPIEVMRVFSPTRANREAFAAEMTEKLDMEVIPVDSPEKALKGADVVSLTTDSLVPVIKAALAGARACISTTCATTKPALTCSPAPTFARASAPRRCSPIGAPRKSSPAATACSASSPAARRRNRKSRLRRITRSTIPTSARFPTSWRAAGLAAPTISRLLF